MSPPAAPAARTPTRSPRTGHSGLWLVVLAGVVLFAGLAGISRALASPSVVPHVTIVNPTRYALDVNVGDGSRGGWMGLAAAGRQTSTDVAEVIDQGDTWVFSFASQGEDGGQVRVTRHELARAGWRLEVPEAVAARLQAAGAPATP